MSSYSRQQLEKYLKTIDVEGKCLDIGGSQNPIKGRTKSWNVNEYKILDLEQPHETKKKPHIKIDIQFESPENYELDYYRNIGKFDVAFCIEVAEYWWNPVQAIRNISELLKEGGVLYISFHFIYPVHQPGDQDYLRYTLAGAIRLLAESGFDIEDIHRRTFHYKDIAKRLYNDEKMRGFEKNSGGIHEDQGYIIKARRL